MSGSADGRSFRRGTAIILVLLLTLVPAAMGSTEPADTIPGPDGPKDVAADRQMAWTRHDVPSDPDAVDLEGVMAVESAPWRPELGVRAHLDTAWFETALVLAPTGSSASGAEPRPLHNTGIRLEQVRFDPPLPLSNGSTIDRIFLSTLVWSADPDAGFARSTAALQNRSHAEPFGIADWRVDVRNDTAAAAPSEAWPTRPLAAASRLDLRIDALDPGRLPRTLNVTIELLLDYGRSDVPLAFVENGTAGVRLDRDGRYAWFLARPDQTNGANASHEMVGAKVIASNGDEIPLANATTGGSARVRIAPLRMQLETRWTPGEGDVEFALSTELGHGFNAAGWERDVETQTPPGVAPDDDTEPADPEASEPIPGPPAVVASILLVWLVERRRRS